MRGRQLTPSARHGGWRPARVRACRSSISDALLQLRRGQDPRSDDADDAAIPELRARALFAAALKKGDANGEARCGKAWLVCRRRRVRIMPSGRRAVSSRSLTKWAARSEQT